MAAANGIERAIPDLQKDADALARGITGLQVRQPTCQLAGGAIGRRDGATQCAQPAQRRWQVAQRGYVLAVDVAAAISAAARSARQDYRPARRSPRPGAARESSQDRDLRRRRCVGPRAPLRVRRSSCDVPTTRSPTPIANSISVAPGARLTMRRGTPASLTVAPVSSVTTSDGAAAPPARSAPGPLLTTLARPCRPARIRVRAWRMPTSSCCNRRRDQPRGHAPCHESLQPARRSPRGQTALQRLQAAQLPGRGQQQPDRIHRAPAQPATQLAAIASCDAPAQGDRSAPSDKCRQPREREQIARHDQRIAPAVSFTLHHRQRRQTLWRKHVPDQQRQCGTQRPLRCRSWLRTPSRRCPRRPTPHRPSPTRRPRLHARRARESSAMQICQLNPNGSKITASALPMRPARLYSIGAPVAPGGGAG